MFDVVGEEDAWEGLGPGGGVWLVFALEEGSAATARKSFNVFLSRLLDVKSDGCVGFVDRDDGDVGWVEG